MAYNYYRNPTLIKEWNLFLQNETLVITGNYGNKNCLIKGEAEKWQIVDIQPTNKVVYKVESQQSKQLDKLTLIFEEHPEGGIKIMAIAEGRHCFFNRFQNLRMDVVLNSFLENTLIKGAQHLNEQGV